MNTHTSAKPTSFWVILLAIVLVLSTAAALFVTFYSPHKAVAKVYVDGELLRSIDLSAVTEPYEFEISGTYHNTLCVENGRIRVSEATCPDRICVHQGYSSGGAVPIVCMPNKLVISFESAADADIDAVLG